MESHELTKYDLILVNRKALNAFGRKYCMCRICRHTGRCEGEVTHLGNDKIYLCAHCANVAHEQGWYIQEMVF